MNMWQPIETAPKDGSSILLATPKGRIADGFWALTYGVWSWPYVMVEPTHWMPLPAPPGSQAQSTPNAVAYLDLGVGGYMDIGTDLTDEELATLPKGRHMLGIIGTYGVDGYVPAQPAPSVPDGWIRAIDEALVVTHLGVANASDTYEQAKAKLDSLVGFHVDVATDPAVNGGWKLVPRPPTPTMVKAGLESSHVLNVHRVLACYDAMIDAAPEAKR